MITPLFVLFCKTILTQEVTMDFYFLINCSISLYNGPFLNDDSFPFKQEYYALKKYLAKLEQKDEVRPRKGNLFDRLR